MSPLEVDATVQFQCLFSMFVRIYRVCICVCMFVCCHAVFLFIKSTCIPNFLVPVSFSSLILTNFVLNNSYNIDVVNLMDLRKMLLLFLLSFFCFRFFLNMFHIVADSVKNFDSKFPLFLIFSPLILIFSHLFQFCFYRHSFFSVCVCVLCVCVFTCFFPFLLIQFVSFHFFLCFYFIVVFAESFVSAKSIRAAPESLASPQSKNLPKIQPKMAMAMAIPINLIGICCCDNCGGEYGF